MADPIERTFTNIMALNPKYTDRIHRIENELKCFGKAGEELLDRFNKAFRVLSAQVGIHYDVVSVPAVQETFLNEMVDTFTNESITDRKYVAAGIIAHVEAMIATPAPQ